MAGEGAAEPQKKFRILDVLEVLAKLIGASAVLVVALFANSLQSRLTGVSIQSQREQAESQLRASMFTSLIGPVAGPTAGDKPMPVDREQIMTELLALNFNENFEMKPLLDDVIKRLTAERAGKPQTGDDPREHLWSIVRRISERQKAAISREWTASRSADSSSTHGCEAYYMNLNMAMERHDAPVNADADCQVAAAFSDIVDLKSPDGNYTLRLVAYHPDWDNQTIRISTQPFLSKQNSPKATDTQYNFTLSWLDLPLTDNTILSDGNRFAVYLRTIYGETVSVTVMWFPKGYFTPRERPLNYTEVQQLLGRKQQ